MFEFEKDFVLDAGGMDSNMTCDPLLHVKVPLSPQLKVIPLKNNLKLKEISLGTVWSWKVESYVGKY